MAGLKKPTALEYSKLTWTQKTYYLACWYLDRCTDEPLFANGRPSKALGTVRGYLKYKCEPKDLQSLYDAVCSLDAKVLMDMSGLYQLSEKIRVEQRMQSNAPGAKVKPYESLMDCLGKL